MEEAPWLSLPEGIIVDQIQITEHGLLIGAIATSPTSCCPLCSQESSMFGSSWYVLLYLSANVL